MGRSKEVERKKLQYKKIGGGSARLVLDGRKTIIKPNQTFAAYPEDIPEAFKDMIIPLEGQAIPKAQKPEPKEKVFGVKKRPKTDGDADPGENAKGKPKSWYDVVNKKSKQVMNPKALTNGSAKKLAESLNL
jgi:hypothetical protein